MLIETEIEDEQKLNEKSEYDESPKKDDSFEFVEEEVVINEKIKQLTDKELQEILNDEDFQ